MSASRMYHNYLLALVQLGNYPWRNVALPEYLGGVECLYMSHVRKSALIQGRPAPFSVGRCQGQRHNVLSLCLYFPCPRSYKTLVRSQTQNKAQ